MDELEHESTSGFTDGANFIPCLTWVKRGVAKSQPEKVKLTPAELAGIIKQTRGQINDLEKAENDEGMDESDVVKDDDNESEPEDDDDDDIEKKYNLDQYDEDSETSTMMGVNDLMFHPDARQDPYLTNPDLDDDASDVDDVQIRPTDNLILVGHVEGDHSILEVYVYNDVEDALYVHHDILLPSFPLALEWMSFDPGESVKGNFCAVGSMDPVIQVWDLDLIDSLEPAFVLGRKKSKKKTKISKGIGHTDAVLSLAWNSQVEHILASGSVDETVLLWDMSEGTVASKISAHKEKIQSLQWHPFENQTLLTGCCDHVVRVFDCRAEDTFKSWKLQGEIEKVLWNHFDPFTFLAATESGNINMIDVRNDSKPVWTLSAHSDGINGLSLSSQCPNCVVSVSTDKTMKVWDISDNQPKCIMEKNMKLGRLHSLSGCPDAPFVVCVGGDKAQDNLKVLDVRESAAVRSCFGNRVLQNPLGTASFGYDTANGAEQVAVIDEPQLEEAIEAMSVDVDGGEEDKSGGAGSKYRKKDKKKKKKKVF